MIAKVKSQALQFKSVIFSLSVILMGFVSSSAIASSPVPLSARQRQSPPANEVVSWDWLRPAIPPLDDPDQFLPLQRYYQTRLVLRLSERRVYIYQGEQEIASYPVAVGKPGWETPTGTFEIISMIENPSWQNPWTGEVRAPGRNSALGLRWIGFWSNGKDTIGFHGTPTVNSIGSAASHGCVRMRNEDVVALYEKVQLGTVVLVEP